MIDPDNPTNFEFETWQRLAKEDPERFEARRLEAIQRFIDSAPESKQARLRGLQWQVDQARARAKSPMGACARVSALMWESVAGRDGLLESLTSLGEVTTGSQRTERTPGAVLPFKRR